MSNYKFDYIVGKTQTSILTDPVAEKANKVQAC